MNSVNGRNWNGDDSDNNGDFGIGENYDNVGNDGDYGFK